MQLKRHLLAAVAVALTLGALSAGAAHAYPQFQFTTGNDRCNLCHVSPAGGGLLTYWGRSESADTISMGDSESFLGDPRPLNGLWEPPSWFDFGGDYRGALIVKDAPDQEPEVLGFPMQIDFYARAKASDFSFNLIAGFRGAARDNTRPPISERVVSREHYVMWQPKTTGPYVRAGRFFPVYGLRMQDHTAQVRRRLGLHILEEPYAASGGLVKSQWEVHGTLYAPSPILSAGRKATGGALYYERRVRDGTSAVGAQTKIDFTGDEARYLAGGVGKLWLEDAKLLLLAELDLGLQTFDADSAPAIGQLAVYAGLTYVPRSWLMFGAILERYDNDLQLEGSGRDAASLTVQWFPRSHWELMLVGKLEAQGEDYAAPNGYGMLMLHYYL